ncbi:MAG: Lrp/AsnC family transcriptional regulator [Halobacteriota archaeon]|nr:Lrp/AsnC family transcriptional regulator [Halobacteriota archaeon]
MDELDKKIIRAFQQDSRQSFSKVAEKVGSSTATVSDRVKKLQNSGIIRGYTALLNTSMIGMTTLIAMVRMKPDYSITKAGEEISQLQEACCVHNVTGDFDILVSLKCFGYDECIKVIEKLKSVSGIERVDTHIVLKTMKEQLEIGL